MSASDKFENATEDLKGQAKEGIGKATGDSKTQNEGTAEQLKANAKDTFENAKDKVADGFSSAKDKLTGKDK